LKISAKKTLSVMLAAILLILTMMSALMSTSSVTTNLLKNGEFESFAEGSFENWSLWKGSHQNTDIAQVDGRTGKAAKLSVNENSGIANLYQTVTLEADTEYIFTAWIKIENVVRQWETAPGVYLALSYNNNIVLTKSDAVNYDTDWQKLEITVDSSVLTGEEWAVQFDLVTEYVKGDIYIDDASLTKKENSSSNPENTENVLQNSDFESFLEGNFENWTVWKGSHQDTDVAQVIDYSGKAAKLSVNSNSGIANLYQAVTLEDDTEYTFSIWVKLENVVRQWETAPGVYLALSYNNNIVLTKSEAINYNTDWQKIEVTVDNSVLPGDEWAVQFDLVIEYIKGDVFVDNACVAKKDDTTSSNPDDSSSSTGSDSGSSSTGSDSTSSSTSSDSSSTSSSESSSSTSSESSSSTSSSESSSSSSSSTTSKPDEEEKAPSLLNNDFEKFSQGNFENWSLWKGSHQNTDISQAAGRTGKAAKITVKDNGGIVNLYQALTLKEKTKYVLTAWIKVENIERQWDEAPGVYLALSYNNNIVLFKSKSINYDTDWQKIEVMVDSSFLKGDEWAVQFDVVAEYIKGDIYVDDVSIDFYRNDSSLGGETGIPTPNPSVTPEKEDEEEDGALLKNSSFEKFSNGAFNNWTLWKGNKGNTKIEQVKGRTGKAAKITVDNNQNIVNLYQEIKLDPKKEYTFSVWIKTENIKLQWPGAQGVYVDLSCDNNKMLASESINKDSGWKKLEVVINGGVLTGKEWSVRFDVAAEYLTGVIYIDDAEIRETGKATPIAKPDEDELLKNNSFEIYSAGNFANWTTWKGNKGNTKIEQVDKGRTGKAAKITVDNNNNIVNLYQEIEIDPKKEYTFSVWVKTEKIALQWPGAQGVYLNFKYNNNVVLMSKPVTTDSGWQKLEVVVNGGILQGDEWGVSLDIAAEFLTGTIYVDDASVKVTGKGTPVPKQAKDELLENSSFEIYSGYNFARWNLNRGNNGNTKLEQTAGRTGKAAKITVDDNNNIVSLYQNIKLNPAYEYTFSVWVRLENIALQWEGAEGVYLALGYNNTTPTRSKVIKADTNNWQRLEVTVGGGDLKGDEWGVMFTLTAEFLTGTIYVDDASMKVTGKYQPKPDTFLQNGSFDATDNDSKIAGWTAFAEDFFSVLDRNTDKAKEGTASASIFNADGNVVSYWEQRLDELDTTKTYLLSGYIFSDMIVSDANGAATFVEFYDPEGNLIKTERSEYVTGEKNEWTPFEIKLTFPENCVTMVVKAALIKAVGTAYFDGFNLIEFNEGTHTAKEGVFENIYYMGITDEESNETVVDNTKQPIPKTVIFIIIGVVIVLLGTGAGVFVFLKKRKAKIEIEDTELEDFPEE